MNIGGIGLVFAGGCGVPALENALRRGWTPPREIDVPLLPGRRFPVYAVDAEKAADPGVAAKIRRADRFTKMAVMAAWDAVKDAAYDTARHSIGVVLATAFGPHVTTFRFLDDILQFGDGAVSPTVFSHSVHNAAASYIATALNVRGPALTLSQLGDSFQQALLLAEAWLAEERCDGVLAGTVDECGQVLAYICAQQLRIATDGKIRPFACAAPPATVPGEGSAFFLLTRQPTENSYASVAVHAGRPRGMAAAPACRIIAADGMSRDETGYRRIGAQGMPIGGYAPLFGSMPTGDAFNFAVGALTLRRQMFYAAPVPDNPQNMILCDQTRAAEIRSVECLKLDCHGDKSAILLTQPS
jgi:3-oxoacyl-[acyl-carrier-protein] synthase II